MNPVLGEILKSHRKEIPEPVIWVFLTVMAPGRWEGYLSNWISNFPGSTGSTFLYSNILVMLHYMGINRRYVTIYWKLVAKEKKSIKYSKNITKALLEKWDLHLPSVQVNPLPHMDWKLQTCPSLLTAKGKFHKSSKQMLKYVFVLKLQISHRFYGNRHINPI